MVLFWYCNWKLSRNSKVSDWGLDVRDRRNRVRIRTRRRARARPTILLRGHSRLRRGFAIFSFFGDGFLGGGVVARFFSCFRARFRRAGSGGVAVRIYGRGSRPTTCVDHGEGAAGVRGQRWGRYRPRLGRCISTRRFLMVMDALCCSGAAAPTAMQKIPF